MVVEIWMWLLLYLLVYLDGGTASVFPGLDGFDDGRELRFGSICSPWAGACVGSGVVGK